MPQAQHAESAGFKVMSVWLFLIDYFQKRGDDVEQYFSEMIGHRLEPGRCESGLRQGPCFKFLDCPHPFQASGRLRLVIFVSSLL